MGFSRSALVLMILSQVASKSPGLALGWGLLVLTLCPQGCWDLLLTGCLGRASLPEQWL